jgi:hypothetical protein
MRFPGFDFGAIDSPSMEEQYAQWLLEPPKPKWGKPGRPKVGPKPKAERLPMRPHHKGKRNV